MPLIALISGDYTPGIRPHWTRALLAAGLPVLPALARMARGIGKSASLSALPAPNLGPGHPGTDQLCTFLSETTRLSPNRKPGQQLANLVLSIFGVESVAIYDDDLQEVYRAGAWSGDVRDALKNVCIFDTVSDDPKTGLSRRVLRIGELPIGAMMIRGETRGQVANAIASVVAITFDRYHSFANESRTESARQVEQLRTSVLDSLAHAYKTPLTVIATASEGLGAMGSLSASQSGLVTLIHEQTALLDRLTTRLLKTARLEASDMIPRAEKVAIAPLLEDIVASLGEQLGSVSVKISISRDDLSLRCDRSLLVVLLTQYVDNAAKYSNPGSMVTIQVTEHAANLIFCVHSFGPVIHPADYERIFDRYYRSSATSNQAPGTGLGLSIAKRTAQAQGGHVWVSSDVEKGTSFFASLPMVPQGGISQ